jgi:hypothetical protein
MSKPVRFYVFDIRNKITVFESNDYHEICEKMAEDPKNLKLGDREVGKNRGKLRDVDISKKLNR